MGALTCINDYLKIYGAELGHRVVDQFPPLHQPTDPVWPAINELKRQPFPAQALAIMAKGRLLYSGAPEPLLAQAAGHVFEWTVDADRVVELRARHVTSSSIRRPDGVRLRIVADASPHADAIACEPTLDDAYLWLLTRAGEQ